MLMKILRMIIWAVLLGVSFLSIQAAAQEKEEIARRIEGELMAPCCWAEPVSQHLSPIAEEMRREIRAMLAVGKTEQEILDIYVAKYGERILTTPPARGFNLLAYIMPWVLAVTGVVAVVVVLKRWLALRSADSATPAVDDRYADRIDRELRDLE
jgi:cytochrome c-type biogenesis protein CcmH